MKNAADESLRSTSLHRRTRDYVVVGPGELELLRKINVNTKLKHLFFCLLLSIFHCYRHYRRLVNTTME